MKKWFAVLGTAVITGVMIRVTTTLVTKVVFESGVPCPSCCKKVNTAAVVCNHCRSKIKKGPTV